jgi:hypothetical protein
MALRRVQTLTETTYWQSIQSGFTAPLAVSAGNSIVTRLNTEITPVEMQLWAQYSESGNNLNLIAYLQRIPGRPIQAGACTFTLTEISGDGVWASVNTDAVIATEDALGRWLAVIPAGDVITNICMGKSTLRIEAVMQRAAQTFKKEIYVNHLGIGEAAAWLRNRMNYVEATKKDE